jgi:hypothetical protein
MRIALENRLDGFAKRLRSVGRTEQEAARRREDAARKDPLSMSPKSGGDVARGDAGSNAGRI